MNPNLRATAEGCNSQRAVIDASARPGLPIFITEWSASYSHRDPVHDHYFAAPFILEQLKHTESLGAMSYWTFTDIFEEGGPPPRPFHGGFGLLTMQGIKKPSYFAYRFLGELGAEELANTDDRSWVCRDMAGNIQALFWDLTPLSDDQTPNQTVFRRDDPPVGQTSVSLSFSALKPGRYRLAVMQVGFQKADAYTAYLEMGAPVHLDRAQMASLTETAHALPDHESEVEVDGTGRWAQEFTVRSNDVFLVKLSALEQ